MKAESKGFTMACRESVEVEMESDEELDNLNVSFHEFSLDGKLIRT